MRHFASRNYSCFFVVSLAKESRRKLLESGERSIEATKMMMMMTMTTSTMVVVAVVEVVVALAGRYRSSTRTEGTKKAAGERVERGR